MSANFMNPVWDDTAEVRVRSNSTISSERVQKLKNQLSFGPSQNSATKRSNEPGSDEPQIPAGIWF
jgi:hypothetical protein